MAELFEALFAAIGLMFESLAGEFGKVSGKKSKRAGQMHRGIER